MSSKSRWNNPADIGQPDYVKVGIRVMFFLILLVVMAMIKIGFNNNWFDFFRNLIGY